MSVKQTEYKNTMGEMIQIPNNFKLNITEISNNFYQIDLYDSNGITVSKQGSDLDRMIKKSVSDLEEILKKVRNEKLDGSTIR